MSEVQFNYPVMAIFQVVYLKARHYFLQFPEESPGKCCGMCILASAGQGLHDAHVSLVLTCCTHTHSFCI